MDNEITGMTTLSQEEFENIFCELQKSAREHTSPIANEHKPKDRRLIWGILSTNTKDLENEIVEQKGMDLERYFMEKGRIKWEHKEIQGPMQYIGYPIAFRKAHNKTLLIAEIYPEEAKHKIANEAWKALESAEISGAPPIGISIEGSYIEKSGDKATETLVINAVLTANPVNTDTAAHILKSLTATPIAMELGEKTGGDAINEDNLSTQKKGGKKMSRTPEDFDRILAESGVSDKKIREKAMKALYGSEYAGTEKFATPTTSGSIIPPSPGTQPELLMQSINRKKTNNDNKPRRITMGKKEAKNREDLDKILEESGVEEETRMKAVKAMFPDDEEELEPEETEWEKKYEAEEGNARKAGKSVDQLLQPLAKAIEKLEMQLGEITDDDEEDDAFRKSIKSAMEIPNDVSTPTEDEYFDFGQILWLMSKGIEGNKELIAQVGALSVEVAKSVHAIAIKDNRVTAKVDAMAKSVEAMSKTHDGIMPEELFKGFIGDNEGKNFTQRMDDADIALQKGIITEGEYSRYNSALTSPKRQGAEEIIKSTSAKINQALAK